MKKKNIAITLFSFLPLLFTGCSPTNSTQTTNAQAFAKVKAVYEEGQEGKALTYQAFVEHFKHKVVYSQEGAQYCDYWNKVVSNLGVSEVAIFLAMESDEGSVNRVQSLNKASELAEKAGEDAKNDAPNKYNSQDISQKLVAAAEKIQEAIRDLKLYYDDGKLSEMAEAEDNIGQASKLEDEATHNARIIYADLGGNTSDLDSVEYNMEAFWAQMHHDAEYEKN